MLASLGDPYTRFLTPEEVIALLKLSICYGSLWEVRNSNLHFFMFASNVLGGDMLAFTCILILVFLIVLLSVQCSSVDKAWGKEEKSEEEGRKD